MFTHQCAITSLVAVIAHFFYPQKEKTKVGAKDVENYGTNSVENDVENLNKGAKTSIYRGNNRNSLVDN